MQTRYPGAEWRPLGEQTEPRIVVPRLFVAHTMSGYLAGTDATFRPHGYDGVESHFGIGGAYDKGDLDGVVWQWQDIGHQADAQAAGNASATSVETSDGNRDGVPWTAKQVASLIDLGVWWCEQTGRPARITDGPDGVGFGWHSQFKAWNPNAHDCPGAVRLKQYKTEVVPEIAHRLAGKAEPKPPRLLKLAKPLMRGPDVEALQKQLNAAGAKPQLATDGVFGTATEREVEDFQRARGLFVDGIVGKDTRRELAKVAG